MPARVDDEARAVSAPLGGAVSAFGGGAAVPDVPAFDAPAVVVGAAAAMVAPAAALGAPASARAERGNG